MLLTAALPAGITTTWEAHCETRTKSGTPEQPIIAICDCQPAVHALNKCTSGEPNMALSLGAARSLTQQWLAVHVNCEDNKDADALSHPDSIQAGRPEKSFFFGPHLSRDY